MNVKQLTALLQKSDFTEIFAEADSLRKQNKGDQIQVRALLEFSNYCKRECQYCGLNRNNSSLKRFRLEPSEIIEIASDAVKAGYQTIVLQSGEDPWYTPEIIGDIVKEIKKLPITVTLSCGEASEETYQYWKNCGADRYLLKHETSDPNLYTSFHPDSSLEERVRCLKTLKKLGFETGGGFMIGLPGQTFETIAKDLLLLQEIGCDMAGVGPFIPHPDTPLGNEKHGNTELTLRTVALARLLLPQCNLPATTALGVLDENEKKMVFSCGANVVMQKVTPLKVRQLYEIYPSHLKAHDILEGRKKIEEEVRLLGRIPI